MTHRNFLIDLITGLEQAGFTGIHVSDVDLGVVRYDEVGADKLADEILSLDDTLSLNIKKEGIGKATLVLFCANDPWETVMDLGFSTDVIQLAVDEVLKPIEEKYTP